MRAIIFLSLLTVAFLSVFTPVKSALNVWPEQNRSHSSVSRGLELLGNFFLNGGSPHHHPKVKAKAKERDLQKVTGQLKGHEGRLAALEIGLTRQKSLLHTQKKKLQLLQDAHNLLNSQTKGNFSAVNRDLARQQQELDSHNQELSSQKLELGSQKQNLARQKQKLESQNRELDSQKLEIGSQKGELDNQKSDIKMVQKNHSAFASWTTKTILRIQKEISQFRGNITREVEKVWEAHGQLTADTNQSVKELRQAIAKTHDLILALTGTQQAFERRLNLQDTRVTELSNTEWIPIGFIYVQLRGQPAPSEVWKQQDYTWDNISGQFQGNFFRVVGGTSAGFGEIQLESFPYIDRVQSVANQFKAPMQTEVLKGQLSRPLVTGSSAAVGASWIGTQFRMTGEEVRPRNEAVRIWRRKA